MVESQPSKLLVASSSLVSRSTLRDINLSRKRKSEKEKILTNLERLKLFYVDSLRSDASQLRNCADRLLENVESDHVKGRYSVNHDCLKISRRVWDTCRSLGEISRIEDTILGTFDYNRLNKSNTTEDK